jgi:hypothetical protein
MIYEGEWKEGIPNGIGKEIWPGRIVKSNIKLN